MEENSLQSVWPTEIFSAFRIEALIRLRMKVESQHNSVERVSDKK